jgi:hypothetical protein
VNLFFFRFDSFIFPFVFSVSSSATTCNRGKHGCCFPLRLRKPIMRMKFKGCSTPIRSDALKRHRVPLPTAFYIAVLCFQICWVTLYPCAWARPIPCPAERNDDIRPQSAHPTKQEHDHDHKTANQGSPPMHEETAIQLESAVYLKANPRVMTTNMRRESRDRQWSNGAAMDATDA